MRADHELYFSAHKFYHAADMGKIVTNRAASCRYYQRLSWRWWRVFVVCVLLVLACREAVAAVNVEASIQRLDLNDRVHYLKDSQGTLDLTYVQQTEEGWQRNSDGVFNKGFSGSVWWLKLELRNPEPQHLERLLEIAYPLLDQVDVYLVQEESLLQTYQTGYSRPFYSRPLVSRVFIFPIDLPPQADLSVFIRVQTASAVQVPLTLWQKQAFSRYEVSNNLLQGLYFGGIFTLLIYNLLVFFVLRDRSYLYYVGFVASAPLFFLGLNGLGYRYLWPEYTSFNRLAIPIFLSSLVIFGALFTRRFLELSRFSKLMDRIIMSFAVIGAAVLGMSFFLPYQTTIPLLALIVIFACFADIAAGLFAWHRQVASARFYVLAWTVFLLGSIIFAFNKLNILPANAFTENAVQVGSILEAILLSFALADRINFERRLRFEAQEENLQAQMRTNEILELRVAERTRELAELNRKLEELSYTDQLTQLPNRRFLEDAVAKEWQRCVRKEADFSVLMLDIDHFKRVNDLYGHEIGDYCLQQVGLQLRESLRFATDIVARYGGEEFCVVLPETDSAGATQVAQRILTTLSRTPLHTDNGDFSITVSIGISSVKSHQNIVLRTLFTQADAALYAAKSQGRNRAVFFGAAGQIN